MDPIPDLVDSSSPSSSLSSSSELQETFRNLTGLLQKEFPSVNLHDIPGFEQTNQGGGGGNFLFFLISLIVGMFWITYITFFNSRRVGQIVTKIVNRFITDQGGYLKVGTIFMNYDQNHDIEAQVG
ncbi:hypothetical protein TCAL_14722 [Tigriopus californicus]|uniref:Uncharacterized protein n=1 Tax=Tigriopus californicus TaxID=6832 RepID=A0A553PGS2_TIGCA|nr:hypothetical protein TCAL_14722 [Tigriopus californicus]|eukprot:TCALIF_12438-PA protein Name:"Protein of unknown function" AED:0.78 eAED:0.78 QI:0/0/0/0.5/0/0/2/0/125